MSIRKLNQAGFEHVTVLILLVVLAGIGFTGYSVYKRGHTTAAATNVSSTSKVPATINSRADLTTAGHALDDSASSVDSSLNDGALNADLNSML